MSIEVEIVDGSNGEKPKRNYITKAEKQHLTTFENLRLTKQELKHLGVIRPDLKDRMVEIVARTNHELAARLRTSSQDFSNQELAVISNLFTQRIQELEKQGSTPQEIDWSKFSVDAFEGKNDIKKLGDDNV